MPSLRKPHETLGFLHLLLDVTCMSHKTSSSSTRESLWLNEHFFFNFLEEIWEESKYYCKIPNPLSEQQMREIVPYPAERK